MIGAPLSFWTAARRVFDLSLGEMLWSRRTIFMALVVGGPVILAIIVRLLEAFGMPALRVNGQRVGGMGVFGMMIWMLFLRFVIPVLGVFYGTALMADEIEDKTITYLFTRPIPRGAVLVGKYLAYLACTSLVVLPSVMVVYFLLVRFSARFLRTFGQLLTDLGLLGVGSGHLRRRFRLCRGLLQASPGHRPGVCVRLGAGRDGHAGLHETVHHRLLHPVAGSACDAVGRGGRTCCKDFSGTRRRSPSRWPGWRPISLSFCILRRERWIGRSMCWSNDAENVVFSSHRLATLWEPRQLADPYNPARGRFSRCPTRRGISCSRRARFWQLG